jgi:intracellular sulfur oxidation DsrE/DsrF family protein
VSRKAAIVHVYGADGRDVQNAIHIAARLAEHEPEAEVTLVVQGPSVAAILSDAVTVQPDSIPGNLALRACAYSLSKLDPPRADLLPGFQTVPAAVVFITEKQWDGAAYLRI